MGVMQCHRKGCEEIMCSTYVSSVGYICSDCQYEFSVLFPKKYSEDELIGKLLKFMNKERRYTTYKDCEGDINAQEFFNKNTN